jgi:hypothetical protein
MKKEVDNVLIYVVFFFDILKESKARAQHRPIEKCIGMDSQEHPSLDM